MVQASGLELSQISEQGARGSHRGIIVGANAEAVERGQVEAPGELLVSEGSVELPRLTTSR
jgi:hypothetical protein